VDYNKDQDLTTGCSHHHSASTASMHMTSIRRDELLIYFLGGSPHTFMSLSDDS